MQFHWLAISSLYITACEEEKMFLQKSIKHEIFSNEPDSNF
jgi:hypothetical protein